jgi:hypothetical protein
MAQELRFELFLRFDLSVQMLEMVIEKSVLLCSPGMIRLIALHCCSNRPALTSAHVNGQVFKVFKHVPFKSYVYFANPYCPDSYTDTTVGSYVS